MRRLNVAVLVAVGFLVGVPTSTFAAPPDISAYTAAIADVMTAITTAVPTMLIAVLAVAAGLIAVRVGVRFARSFIK